MYGESMCVKGGVCCVCRERACVLTCVRGKNECVWMCKELRVGTLALTMRQAYLSGVHSLEDWEKNVVYLALAPPHPVLCKPGTPQLRKSTTASLS